MRWPAARTIKVSPTSVKNAKERGQFARALALSRHNFAGSRRQAVLLTPTTLN